MRVEVSEHYVEVILAPWERVLGLLGNIRIAREEISGVRVVEDPMREVMAAGLKAGLRIPWLCYVCRTIRLDRAWVVRRGLPALSLQIEGDSRLREVTLSTARAEELARQLERPDGHPRRT